MSDLEVRLSDSGGAVRAEKLPRLRARPTQMRQLMQNLVGNALEFSKPGVAPLVTVSAARRKDQSSLAAAWELTETAFSADPTAMHAALSTLHAAGVRIALDDFGTGYSSLASLIDFPIDVLKLDRRFIRDLPVDRRAERMVQGVVNLFEGLGIQAVAEGVESEPQERFLAAAGCPMAQGYLLARPMPLAALEDRLRAASR